MHSNESQCATVGRKNNLLPPSNHKSIFCGSRAPWLFVAQPTSRLCCTPRSVKKTIFLRRQRLNSCASFSSVAWPACPSKRCKGYTEDAAARHRKWIRMAREAADNDEAYLTTFQATTKKAGRENRYSEKCSRIRAVAYEHSLEQGGAFRDDVNEGYLLEELVLAARRVETAWVHFEGVYDIVQLQECIDAGEKPMNLIWVNTDKSVDPAHKNISFQAVAREYKETDANREVGVPKSPCELRVQSTTACIDVALATLVCAHCLDSPQRAEDSHVWVQEVKFSSKLRSMICATKATRV